MEQILNKKIFIVDDDKVWASVLEKFLNNESIVNIERFENGLDCLDNMELNPDIIFLDYNMDNLTGLEVLKKIKRINPNIFIIMVSAQEIIGNVINTFQYGAFDYIEKDVNSFERLKEVLQRIDSIYIQIKKDNKSPLFKIISSIV